jgi:hypothetical protein
MTLKTSFRLESCVNTSKSWNISGTGYFICQVCASFCRQSFLTERERSLESVQYGAHCPDIQLAISPANIRDIMCVVIACGIFFKEAADL